MTELREGVAPEDFLERVKRLGQGESAVMAGSQRVMRIAREDGSDGWRVEQIGSFYYGDRRDGGHDTAEQAVADCMGRSARSAAPDSLGGARLRLYGEHEIDGKRYRFLAFDPASGKARVRAVQTEQSGVIGPYDTNVGTELVDPAKLTRRPESWDLYESDGGVLGAALDGAPELREAEVGKPGTNWKQVGPDARKKLSGLVKHYMAKAHPFTACVRDNRKRFGPGAEKVCAVVKDLGHGGTDWRSGGKKTVTEAAEVEALEALVEAAGGDWGAVAGMLLESAPADVQAAGLEIREADETVRITTRDVPLVRPADDEPSEGERTDALGFRRDRAADVMAQDYFPGQYT